MNEVEEYLFNNKNKKLALNTIYRNLSLKKRNIFYQIKTSSNIRRVNPIEVGSGKHSISVFTYCED